MFANSLPAPLLCVVLIGLSVVGCGDKNPATDPAVANTPAAPAAQTPPAPVLETPPELEVLSGQDLFWQRLSTLCGKAFAGYLTVGTEPSDREFGEADMIMHVRDCAETEMRIPFHVGENRSRTWILRRDGDALTLKHQHLDENGEVEEPHNYGGRTREDGTPDRQAFFVDEQTRNALPATRYNVWAIEIKAGSLFAYELQRPEEDRFFRIEFELDAPVASPPAAWGYDANTPSDSG